MNYIEQIYRIYIIFSHNKATFKNEWFGFSLVENSLVIHLCDLILKQTLSLVHIFFLLKTTFDMDLSNGHGIPRVVVNYNTVLLLLLSNKR